MFPCLPTKLSSRKNDKEHFTLLGRKDDRKQI